MDDGLGGHRRWSSLKLRSHSNRNQRRCRSSNNRALSCISRQAAAARMACSRNLGNVQSSASCIDCSNRAKKKSLLRGRGRLVLVRTTTRHSCEFISIVRLIHDLDSAGVIYGGGHVDETISRSSVRQVRLAPRSHG